MLTSRRIAGISKTTYVLATPRCLKWRHDLQRTSTSSPPFPIDHPRCLFSSRRDAYRCPQLPVVGGLVFVGKITPPRGAARAALTRQYSRRPPWCTWRG